MVHTGFADFRLQKAAKLQKHVKKLEMQGWEFMDQYLAMKGAAVATDKAKKVAGRAKEATDQVVDRVKPTAKKVAEKTGAAVDAGMFAAGKQLGRASGMFSAFKDEFQKAMNEEDEDE